MSKYYIDGCEIPEKVYLKIKHKCDMWYKESQKLQQENQQLKEVLDEIREYLNKRCLEEDGLVCYGDNLSPIDLMQILDKVKE
jgi:hypothetical protein